MAENTAPDYLPDDTVVMRELNQKCREVMEEKRETMGRELEENFNTHMAEVQHRYQSQKRESIVGWQTDILRMNKIFRDIARHLGADWRPVFHILMGPLELSEAEVDLELRKIEKQKPFMQAYKALLTWKEMNGDQFDMLQLVDALKKSDQYELAEKTLDILDSQGDSLMDLDQVGKGIVSGSRGGACGAGTDSTTTNGTGAEGGSTAETGAKKTPAPRKQEPSSLNGGLSDRNMLQLAKKVGSDWVSLGQALLLSQDAIDEIVEGEGHCYQGCFKMLWSWRDTLNEMEEEQNIQTLKQAMGKVGKKDLFAAVFGSQ